MARTFQNIRLFANMTALENVLVGRHTRTRPARRRSSGPAVPPRGGGQPAGARSCSSSSASAGAAEHLARNLPYGDQRRLEIARALASEPGLLLLDEPTAGMNPQETRPAEDLVFAIRDQGLAVVVIEHDMRFIFSLCGRVRCLVHGEKLVEGTPARCSHDPRVIEAYIGSRSRATDRATPRSRRPTAPRTRPQDDRREEEQADDRAARGPDLRVAYGKIEAVKGISFSVEQGEIVTLIGRTARARRRRCGRSPGCSGPPTARCCSPASAIERRAAHVIVTLGLAHSSGGPEDLPAA